MAAAERSRIGVIVLAATLLLGAVLIAVVRAAIPGDGVAIRRTLPPSPDGGVWVSLLPGAETNLRPGDVVTAVHGPDGDRVTYTAWRDGQPLEAASTVKPYPWRTLLGNEWPTIVLVASFLAVALYVFFRRPDDRAAQTLLVASSLLVLASTSWILRFQLTDIGRLGWWLFFVGALAYALVWAAVLHFALVFPTTRAIVRRWTGVAAVYALPLLLHAGYLAVVLPTTEGGLPRARLTAATAVLSEYVFPVAIVAVLVWSYRACEKALMRQRLRWIVGSFLLATLLYLVLWKIPYGLGAEPLVSRELHTLVFLPCPVALAAAILRTRLFDIEVIVRRSLVYVSLTACVIAIYAVVVGLMSALFDRGGDGFAPLLATGLVAVLFSPLRDRLQSAVSRKVYGERDDPYALVARLGQRLEGTLVPDEILPTVVDTVAEALRLPYVAIDLVQPTGRERVAESGTPTAHPLTLPITHRGELVGWLVLGERTPGEAFGPADLRVLEGLARQVAVAAQTVRLTRELQQSRERLVAAREEERLRLRRDLHDGLGPTLAATTLQLSVANRLVRADPDAAGTVIGEVSETMRGAMADVRRIVDDLRPPALDELGLVSALEQRASSLSTANGGAPDGGDGDGMVVSVEAEGDFDSLPAAVEVAAFRIACEAMNNACRHSGARRCSVRLARHRALEVQVADDGQGLPATYEPGVGLSSMRERAAELGGVCTIERGPNGGTVVSARLPLAP